jgi:hypothetical protein
LVESYAAGRKELAMQIELEDLERVTKEVFASHGKPCELKFQNMDGKWLWVLSTKTRCHAVNKDKATAIKKALHDSGFLHEVVEKLKQGAQVE